MIVIGLTGSIGMGKTETARMFAEQGIPVSDSDAIVHRLYEEGGAAVAPVEKAFPGVVTDGRIDRKKLARHLSSHPGDFARLENIVHPLVRAEQAKFLAETRKLKKPLAVLERRRVLARPGMTEEKFAAILARQLPDAEKRARADFIVDSDRGFDHARRQVRAIIAAISAGDSA
jgi:dephospho-CoA kinase